MKKLRRGDMIYPMCDMWIYGCVEDGDCAMDDFNEYVGWTTEMIIIALSFESFVKRVELNTGMTVIDGRFRNKS